MFADSSTTFNYVFGTQPTPSALVVVSTAVVAAIVVFVSAAWRLARNVITIAHEGGHAFVALLTGRRLHGIRLHSDTSGLTYTQGSRRGPSAVLTLMAGYLTPAVIGLVSAGLIWMGNVVLLLWVSLLLLVAMALFIRNVYGVFSIVVVGFAVFAIAWWADPQLQSALAYVGTWFLLFGSVRPVFEVWRQRRRGGSSDPEQLAGMTRIPASLWTLLFAVCNIAALAAGIRLLLPSELTW